MKTLSKTLLVAGFSLAILLNQAVAQTEGVAKFEGTLQTYTGDLDHWAVAWVTKQDGTFIKSLRRQGPSATATHWNSHCRKWWEAKGLANGNNVLDGYSSATARDYSGINSPVILTWNCRDTNNFIVPDGTYLFWLQYAEDAGQGPHTTNGLAWVKGPTPGPVTNLYTGVLNRITNLRVIWEPAKIPPTITSAAPPSTAKVGVSYNHTVTATGTAPITFTASGLPPGITISTEGVISGPPTAAGVFSGTISAANGTLPNATQNFSITVAEATAAPTITSAPPPSTATVGVAYSHTATAIGTAPITFGASGLPAGLSLSTAGVLSGTPTTEGVFTGAITASNGTPPDASQPFSITVSPADPVSIGSVKTENGNIVMSGTGPANASYSVLASGDVTKPVVDWSSVGSGTIDASGQFSYTNLPSAGVTQQFYRVRVGP